MTGDPTRPPPSSRGPLATIEGLRWLRRMVVDRLDAIEAMARRLASTSTQSDEVAALERDLRRKLDELDAESGRRQAEWEAAIAQLEEERRRLAEAWERVERHRIEVPAGVDVPPTPNAPPRGATTTALPHPAATAPMRPAAIVAEPRDVVARAILREFQALSRDVRSNAEARRDHP